MPFGIGIAKLVLTLAAAPLFGAKRLPELASGPGLGIRAFHRALHEEDRSGAGTPPPPREPGG